ncbi:MAG: Crp/Fnr family transcriptional regulator [Bacillota bacterium]
MKNSENHTSCIASVPIFKTLDHAEMKEIMKLSSHKEFEKGSIIFSSGDVLNDLYVIDTGKVKIARLTKDGREQVIRVLSDGDFFGELTLFNDEEIQTFAEVIEPAVICYLNGEKLKTLMNRHPNILFKMMSELSKRLEKAETLIEYNNLHTSEAKVAKLLLDLSDNATVTFQTTKAILASNLGIKPETFSRKLKSLKDKGLIQITSNKSIKILDELALQALIDLDE